jgi:hypothetical protein
VLDAGDDYIWPATGVLTYGGTGITATGLEINVLDGIAATLTYDELDYLDIAALGTGAASQAVVLDAGEDYTWPATGVLTYGGTGVTANGAELNYLDLAALGTGAASKAVVLDAGDDYIWPATGVLTYGGTGITATGLEINVLDGIAATLTYDELDYLDIAALGTGAASKAVVLDAGDDYTWPATGVLTYGGTGVTANGAELNYLDLAALGTGAASKAVVLDAGEDYIWPATGFLTYGGTQVTANGAEMNYLDIAALGTGAASKAVVLDAGDDYTWPATGVLTYGVLNDGTDAIAATAAEINAHVDPTGRMVTSGATENITVAAHAGRIVLLTGAGALTRTLPAATGTGNIYRFVVGVVNASHIITVNGTPGTDTIDGGAIGMQDGGDTVEGWEADGADNTVTLNGTTTGGQIGDWVEIIDIAAGQFSVTAQIVQTGAQATPFS